MIVGVAIKNRETGQVFAMTKPARHREVISALAEAGKWEHAKGEQGFLTNDGKFLNRFQARGYAELHEQATLYRVGIRDLLSEDLW